MTIRLYTEDWLYNAGIVGLINILEISAEIELKKTDHYVEIPKEALENFSDHYFRYFYYKYKRMTSWYKIVNQKESLERFQLSNFDDKKLDELNKIVENTKGKLTSSSYSNTLHLLGNNGERLQVLSKQLKKIKKKKNEEIDDIWESVEELIQDLKEAIVHLKSPLAQKYIPARNIIYDLIGNYWEGVSFLHKKANTNDMYESYYEYFITPVIRYLEEKKSNKYEKYKYHCFTCENKMANLSSAYELTWINKTGVDSSRKSSHFWNFQSDAYVCPVCNLVYSCVPAGFTYLKGKGIFINENSTVKTLYHVNQIALDNVGKFEELEEKSYFQILDSFEQAKVDKSVKEIQNIQIIKLDTTKENSRTPYHFNILSKDRLTILTKNKDRFKKILGVYAKEDKVYLNLYQEVINRLYQNQNQFDLIYRLFRLLISGRFRGVSSIRHILYINHQSMREGKRGSMVGYKKIKQFQYYGIQLRNAYKEQNNKLPGISYRLLNALKLKNETNFMNTLINAYMYKKIQIPLDFIETLQDKDKLQTIGYAFLLGLQGDKGDQTPTDVKEEESYE